MRSLHLRERGVRLCHLARARIAGGRRTPVVIQGFTYLFLLHGLLQVRFGFVIIYLVE